MKPVYILIFSVLFISSCNRINEYSVESNSGVNLEKCRVDLRNLSISREPIPVFYKNTIRNINTEYGENDWLFNYNDSLYANFRHFITNRHDRFKYRFNYIRRSNVFYIEYEIKGKNIEYFEKGRLTMSTTLNKPR